MGSVVSPMPDNAPVSSASVLPFLLLTFITLCYVYYRIVNKRFFQLASQFPGPPSLPLIGHIFEIFFVGHTCHELFKKGFAYSFIYSKVGGAWFGHRFAVVLVDPRDIEKVLGSSTHIMKPVEYDLFSPWLGNGLLISNGETWRAHRKLIAPTFHLNVLKSFFDRFNSNSRDLVAKLRTEVGKEFDIHDYMGECTVEILLETVMGVSKKTQTNGFEYASAVMKMCTVLQMRQVLFWLRPDFVFRLSKLGKEQVKLLEIIHSLTKKVLQNKKSKNSNINFKFQERLQQESKTVTNEVKKQEVFKHTKKFDKVTSTEVNYSFGQAAELKDDLDFDDIGEKKRSPFLDSMIEYAETGNLLTDKEVEEQVNTIMFEGHDTVAAASSFFLCIMAVRHDIQDKCFEELASLFGDSDRPCSFQDTMEMKFLERCIMETLRMYPPVPLIGRHVYEEVPLASENLTIPANSSVAIATFGLHRRPDLYPNPEHFDPDRFLPERSASRHYYSFIPFSAGPRSCVGRKYAMLKLKVVLSTVMRNFKIVNGKNMKDWKLQADIILKREDGFNITIEPRKKEAGTVL